MLAYTAFFPVVIILHQGLFLPLGQTLAAEPKSVFEAAGPRGAVPVERAQEDKKDQ